MRKIIALIGAPGGGKSTQAQLLSKALPMSEIISTGDIARALRSGSYHNDPRMSAFQMQYEKDRDSAIAVGSSGRRISDRLMISCINALTSDGTDLILDGFPRSEEQANWLKQKAQHDSVTIFDLQLSEALAMQRMSDRQRNDDQPEIIANRHKQYVDSMRTINDVIAQSRITVVPLDASLRSEDIQSLILNQQRD